MEEDFTHVSRISAHVRLEFACEIKTALADAFKKDTSRVEDERLRLRQDVSDLIRIGREKEYK
jgi:hypothetical protein